MNGSKGIGIRSNIHIAVDDVPRLRSCGAERDGAARAALKEGVVGTGLLVAVGIDVGHCQAGTNCGIAGGHREGVGARVFGNGDVIIVGILHMDVEDVARGHAAAVCEGDGCVASIVGVGADGDALS